jgi:hypothetical protein
MPQNISVVHTLPEICAQLKYFISNNVKNREEIYNNQQIHTTENFVKVCKKIVRCHEFQITYKHIYLSFQSYIF